MLYISAILHEIGSYVNTSSLHKHSMYLVMNSELFGLSTADVLLVALVTRYHRRSTPKPTHPYYNTLDRDGRVAVAKMAAILRIALSLDAARSSRIRELECHPQGELADRIDPRCRRPVRRTAGAQAESRNV